MAKFLLMPRIPLKHLPEEPRLTDGNDSIFCKKNGWQQLARLKRPCIILRSNSQKLLCFLLFFIRALLYVVRALIHFCHFEFET